jgi:hypothetical protein
MVYFGELRANPVCKPANQREAYLARLVFLICLGVPFAWSWYQIGRFKESRSWHLAIPLLCGSFSYLFLVLVAQVPSALGHSYTPTRYHIIETNFAVSLLAAVVAFTRFKIDGLLTGLGCFLLAFSWVFVLMVNSAI